MAVAMSSASMFVAMSRLETTCAKSWSCSTSMPSWPPRASISRIVSALTGWVDAKSSAAARMDSNCSSLPLTVFFMSRYAPSMRSALSTAL